MSNTKYDVIVIGGGHAGIEAAAGSARVGVKTALITFSLHNIGEMSCNPSIGGLAKGHLVREIDALDGVMAKAIDKAGIQFRVLNASKGPAVWGLRAQADRDIYKAEALKLLESQDNLDIIEDEVLDIELSGAKISAMICKKSGRIECSNVVLTTGTFLKGVMHLGDEEIKGGRINMDGDEEEASYGISPFLEKNGFDLIRLKTGTPPRIRRNTIDYSKLEEQFSDENPVAFSYLTSAESIKNGKMISCHISATNEEIHENIRKVVKEGRSPLFNGQIDSIGPRYCPSIEDKVVRFAHHQTHHVFLEPEGMESDLVYPNGISTSLPKDVQEKEFKKIKGLENCEIVRYGYAIEYDAIDARELGSDLQSNRIGGLYFAGQINGTSGYEEAAAQGIVAGINAGLNVKNIDPLDIDRTNSYVGVLINDITTLGVDEPYRMFTSRSEYRLSVRADNADQRLTQMGIEAGCVGIDRQKVFENKVKRLEKVRKISAESSILPKALKKFDIELGSGAKSQKVKDLFKFPGVTLEKVIEIFPELNEFDHEILRQVAIEAKYEGYLKRQEADIKAFQKDNYLKIPADIDYDSLDGMTLEVISKLKKVRPKTIAEANRIPGMTPSAIIVLLRAVSS